MTAYEKLAGEPFSAWLERVGVRARVLIRPKAGILDPQGQAVERALPALGFDGVRNVHVGRLVELDVEDPAQLPAMCEQLLANPLVEDYEIVGAREVRRHPVPRAPATSATRCTPRRGSATRCCCGTATTTCRASTR